jgi:hypothetical protein
MNNPVDSIRNDLEKAVVQSMQSNVDLNINRYHIAVAECALNIFKNAAFKNIPDLDKKIKIFSERIEREYSRSEITIKSLDEIDIAIHDVTLVKSLKYGTSWFDPVLDFNLIMSNAVLDMINNSI